MADRPVMLITGTRKGIGEHLARRYAARGYAVVGCSRQPAGYELEGYRHVCLDVTDEAAVKACFGELRRTEGRLDVLINNAGIASMNHCLLTPASAVEKLLQTNVVGTFLFCREAARLMQKSGSGRIVNFTSVAVPLKLEGEAAYAASKAAVESLTRVLARELADLRITVNAVGPTPIATDLIRNVPEEKIESLLKRQAIRRMGEFGDVANVVDFFIQPESDFVTGQVLYLGGVS
ncbi:MAG: SDR family NAD(P)-dependent oxidoreductase [Thermoguttaceae bacterium]